MCSPALHLCECHLHSGGPRPPVSAGRLPRCPAPPSLEAGAVHLLPGGTSEENVSSTWLEGISGHQAQPLLPLLLGGASSRTTAPVHRGPSSPRLVLRPEHKPPAGRHGVLVTGSLDTCHIPHLLSGVTSTTRVVWVRREALSSLVRGCCPEYSRAPGRERTLHEPRSRASRPGRRGDPRTLAPETGFRGLWLLSSRCPCADRWQGEGRRHEIFFKWLYLDRIHTP